MKEKSKSLTFKIFGSTFLVGAIVYVLCAVVSISSMYTYFEKQIFNELETECTFLENYALNNETEVLASLNSKNRITLIHHDGTVFYDSEIDASQMENHSDRKEFVLALQNGTGKSSRMSSTMTEKTLYFAKLLDNGDVIRVSVNQHSVGVLVLGMSEVLLIMLVVAVIISFVMANYLSKKIVEPLNQINFDDPEHSDVYEELKPFTARIAEENFEKSQREQLRQQFTANVSHELKTPLTSISGFAEILKSGQTDQKTTMDFAATIYDESQRMISLVNDIIKLSKLDEESICLEKEKVSLKEEASEAVKILSSAAQSRKVALNLEGDDGIIYGVQPVIYEMVYNLIDNAIKYNKENGTVNVKITQDKEINRVIFSVSDTGIGIPECEKERIFERFYRIDKSRSKTLGGTGLGLSIVKHGAKYHNAIVTVDSEVGKGSTFKIMFKTE